MYQAQTFNRRTNELLMESDTFETLDEATDFIQNIGRGEGFYTTIFKLNAVWSDLD